MWKSLSGKKNLSVRWLIIPFLILLGLGFFSKEISIFGINPRSMTFSESVRDLARSNYDADRGSTGYNFGSLKKHSIDILLLGDSHARMLLPNFADELNKRNWRGFHPYTKKNRSNFLSILPGTSESFLMEWMLEIEELAKDSKAIVVSFRHTRSKDNYFYDPILPYSDDTFLKSYRERILQLAKLVPKLVIVAPFPESPQWGPNIGRVYLQDKQDLSLIHI